jgi:ABC-2 type transport system permease protein
MSAVWAILKREVQAYFVSPIAYGFLVIFLTLVGLGFLITVEAYIRMPAALMEEAGRNVRTVIVGGPEGLVMWTQIAMILCLPGLSMRLLSEERKAGTAELLFTSPLTTAQLVLGKYLGTLAVFTLLLVLTAPLVGVLAWKTEPEWAALGVAYVGMLLYGAVILAIGLLASALTENQFIALVLTYLMIVPLYVVERLVGFLGSPLDEILLGLAFSFGLSNAALGALDSHFLVLGGGLVFLSLFLAGQVLDSTRWR